MECKYHGKPCAYRDDIADLRAELASVRQEWGELRSALENMPIGCLIRVKEGWFFVDSVPRVRSMNPKATAGEVLAALNRREGGVRCIRNSKLHTR